MVRSPAGFSLSFRDLVRLKDRRAARYRIGQAAPMEIIDPRDTRPAIIDYIRRTHAINASQLGPKIRVGMRP